MADSLATKDVAERIGVSESTVKLWTDRLGLEVERDSRHNRRYPPEVADLLNTVKGLRDEGKGYQTIQRLIKRAPSEQSSGADEASPPDERPLSERQTIDLDALTEQLSAAVVATIKADNEQAEKYARAAHRIGQLEAENAALRSEVAHLRSILSLPLWRYITQGRRMLADAPAGHALPPGTEQAPS